VPQLYGVIRWSFLQCAVDTPQVLHRSRANKKVRYVSCVHYRDSVMLLCSRNSRACDYVHLRLLIGDGSIPVTLRPKARLWGRWHAGFAGLNPTEGLAVCRLWVLIVRYRSLRTADPSSRGILPIVCVIECDHVQPSTPTMNRWTRDEIRLRKKESKKERKKERKKGTRCVHGWNCDTAIARLRSTEVCREVLLGSGAEIWRICKGMST